MRRPILGWLLLVSLVMFTACARTPINQPSASTNASPGPTSSSAEPGPTDRPPTPTGFPPGSTASATTGGSRTSVPSPTIMRPTGALHDITITLLRHAEPSDAAAGLISTKVPGSGLGSKGNQQARAAAKALDYAEFDSLFCSPLARAKQTAAVFADESGLSAQQLDGLAEITAGDYEGRRADQYAAAMLETPTKWLRGDLTARIPGGEDGATFFGRVDQALADVYGYGVRNSLLVSHSGTIFYWVNARVSIGDQTPPDLLGYTGYVTITGNPWDGWKLVEWKSSAI